MAFNRVYQSSCAVLCRWRGGTREEGWVLNLKGDTSRTLHAIFSFFSLLLFLFFSSFFLIVLFFPFFGVEMTSRIIRLLVFVGEIDLTRAQCPDWRDDTVIRCILITSVFAHDIHRRALSIKLVDLVRYKVKLSRTTSRFIVVTTRNDKTSKYNRSYVCTHLDTWLYRSIDVPSDISVRSILL